MRTQQQFAKVSPSFMQMFLNSHVSQRTLSLVFLEPPSDDWKMQVGMALGFIVFIGLVWCWFMAQVWKAIFYTVVLAAIYIGCRRYPVLAASLVGGLFLLYLLYKTVKYCCCGEKFAEDAEAEDEAAPLKEGEAEKEGEEAAATEG
jgi:hypothetical protein